MANNFQTLEISNTKLTNLNNIQTPATMFGIANSPLTDANFLPSTGFQQVQTAVFDSCNMTALHLEQMPATVFIELNNLPALNTLTFSATSKIEALLMNQVALTAFSGQTQPNLVNLQITNSPSLKDMSQNDFEGLTSLELIATGVTSIDTTAMPNLETLNLQDNKIATISGQGWPDLASATLFNNGLTTFGSGSTLSSLTYLEVREANITLSLDLQISTATKINTIILDNVNIGSLQNFQFPSLSTLKLNSGNNLVTVANNVLPSLTNLTLTNANTLNSDIFGSGNTFAALSSAYLDNVKIPLLQGISHATLAYLTAINTNTTNFSGNTMPALTSLVLGDSLSDSTASPLTTVSFGGCPNLKSITVVNTILPAFSIDTALAGLTTLRLDGNRLLTSVDLTNATNSLVSINISQTAIASFTGSYPNLTSLYAVYTQQLQTLNLGAAAPKLAILRVEYSSITAFTEPLSNGFKQVSFAHSTAFTTYTAQATSQLVSLDLSYTGMTTFNGYSSSSLITLDLSNTASLTAFGSNTLTALQTLNLENCNIATFTTASLPQLLSLDLSGNSLEDTFLTGFNPAMPKIQLIDLRDNAWGNPAAVKSTL